jgi:hypothetical protein
VIPRGWAARVQEFEQSGLALGDLTGEIARDMPMLQDGLFVSGTEETDGRNLRRRPAGLSEILEDLREKRFIAKFCQKSARRIVPYFG